MSVVLVVYDSVLFDVGHNVRRWADAVERRFTANAIAFAPVNKRLNKSDWYKEFPVGSLKASITGDVDRIGPKHLQTTISVNVPYAIYVIEGTSAIVPTTSPRMKLPFNAGFTVLSPRRAFDANNPAEHSDFGKATYHRVVSGQSANNFLTRAADVTALRHPSLRGKGALVFEQF